MSGNVSAMLARLATGNGGVSQQQAELNAGYEKIATVFATCFLAGWALHLSDEPELQELLDQVTQGLDGHVEKVAQALLRHKGEPVGDILRAITNH